MWGSRTWNRLFNNRTAPTSPPEVAGGRTNVNVNLNLSDPAVRDLRFRQGRRVETDDDMDGEDLQFIRITPYDSYDLQKAKQRASIKWLLSKAYNHKIPEELADPFYKDNEGEEHLKPHIIQGLSNAELYCLALCNIYADPNYSQLSPWGIVQALARKGVYVQQPQDLQLTETILMQNRPLRLVAHMAVIEAMMVLKVKETISNDKIVNTVQRYGPSVHPQGVWLGSGELPSDTEEALLLWINRAVLAIKEYVQNNNAQEHSLSASQVDNWTQLPLFQDLTDLADGVGLCSLLAFYCQEELALSEIAVPTPNDPLSVADSLWNLQLVQRVCRDSLPYNVCHFAFEDVLYLHESMKQNFLNFLVDLFNQLELQPTANVKLLGSHQIAIRPDRKGMSSRPQSATTTPKRQNSSGGQERGRTSTTLNILGDPSSGRKSPSNSSVVSVPIRRAGTPQEYGSERVPDLSSNKEQRYYAHSRSSDDSEDFVVHRGRNVPTLSQVIRSVSPPSSQEERSSPASRVSVARSISAIEDPDGHAAGRPSNWNANKTTYAGRRSRRNSITEADSQLTVENFGGSQDNLNKIAITRNPDKQPAVLSEATPSPVRYLRGQSAEDPPNYHNYETTSSNDYSRHNDRVESSPKPKIIPPTPGGNGDVAFYGRKKFKHPMDEVEDNVEYYDRRDGPPPQPKNHGVTHSGSQGNVTVYVASKQGGDAPETVHDVPYRSTSMSNLSRLSDVPNKPVNIVYLGNNNSPAQPSNTGEGHSYSVTSSNGWDRSRQVSNEYQTMPPQHSDFNSSSNTPYRSPYHRPPSQYNTPPGYNHNESDLLHDDDIETAEIAEQVAAIRQKLEDKRRRIEAEKSRLEVAASKQQHKLGKAAYLKAINKGQSTTGGTFSGNVSMPVKSAGHNIKQPPDAGGRKKHLNLKDLENKWLSKTEEQCRTPEIENMDLETYQRSLARMDTSLTELESDIGRLALQQENIHRQFFLHGEPSGDEMRRKKVSSGGYSSGTSQSRSQWGPPKPFAESSSSDESTQRGGGGSAYNGNSRGRTVARSSINSSNYSSPSFRLHSNADTQGNRLFSHPSEPREENREYEDDKPTPPPRPSRAVYHAPLPTPPPDDMEPQSVSFVQDEAVPISSDTASLSSKKSSLQQITSGSKTYRITPESGSPPRPTAHKLFSANADHSIPSSEEASSIAEKGFYITFEDQGPRKPKPPLRTRSPARRRDGSSGPGDRARDLTTEYIQSIVERVPIPTDSNSDEDTNRRIQRRPGARNDSEGTGGSADGGELVMDGKPLLDSEELYEMEKKKERILMQSLKRQQQVEELRRVKEMERQRKVDEEAMRQDEKLRKKEEEKARRQAILESYRLRKQDEMDKDTKGGWEVQENSAKRFMRPKSSTNVGPRPRPKTIHLSEVDSAGANRTGHGSLRRSDSQSSSQSLARSYGKKGSSNTLYSESGAATRSRSRDPWGSTSSLNQDTRRRTPSSTFDRGSRRRDMSTSRLEVRSRRDRYMGSQESLGHRVNSTSSLMDGVDTDSSAGAGHRDSDSGVGTCSPPRPRSPSSKVITSSPFQTAIQKRVQSAGYHQSPATSTTVPQKPSCLLPSPSGPGPGSLPPGLISRRHRGFDDGASDISSVASSNMDFSGLRLYKQPTAKSNRSIMLNAVEYCVFPGVVNREHKMRVLDEINRSESKHFLIMFRDAGCQFRALYSYIPEREEVVKLFGVGPKQVFDDMFDKFFKYNSGGKKFSQVHTKHLTVTIDAFTIHNALWQGKRAPAAKTRDLPLVI